MSREESASRRKVQQGPGTDPKHNVPALRHSPASLQLLPPRHARDADREPVVAPHPPSPWRHTGSADPGCERGGHPLSLRGLGLASGGSPLCMTCKVCICILLHAASSDYSAYALSSLFCLSPKATPFGRLSTREQRSEQLLSLTPPAFLNARTFYR